jgi:tetratricopeptide (TPR) repeat protein
MVEYTAICSGLIQGKETMSSEIHAAMQQGVAFFQSGRLPQAEQVFRAILSREPWQVNALQLLGLTLFQQGRPTEGEKFLRKAIRRNPKVSKLHFNLGQMLDMQNKPREALSAFREADKLNPKDEWTLVNLGIVYGKLNRLEEAVAACRRALKINPRNSSALSNLGQLLWRAGDIREGAACLEQALAMDPDHLEALVNLSGICLDQGDLERAGELLERALQLSPENPVVLNNMAGLLLAKGQLADAGMMARKALELNPRFAEAAFHLGRILAEQGETEESAQAFQQCISLNPGHIEAHLGLGAKLKELGRLEEAASTHEKVLARDPDSKGGAVGLASVRIEQGRWQEALDLCNRVLEADPDYAEAHWNRSLALLAKGELARGWHDYEWRWRKSHRVARVLPYYMWDGSSLQGKTVLVYAEQGLGDEIMFASCIPDLLELGPARCILECDLRLAPLFQRSFPDVMVVGRHEDGKLDWLAQLPEVDLQLPIGSLPRYFRSSMDMFPNRKSFLIPDEKRLQKWQRRYEGLGAGLKVGISWKGGSKDVGKAKRSVPLERWLPLFRSGQAVFVNLQYGDCREELARFDQDAGVPIHDWDDADPLTEQEDFAAQVAALDLVISIDNATVHLAGAVGAKVWTLLPQAAEFRWMEQRQDTPWYPSMRLFRQQGDGDWSEVMDELGEALGELCG